MEEKTSIMEESKAIQDGINIPTENISEIHEALNCGLVRVRFLKLDGEERTFECTLASHLLPEAEKDWKSPRTHRSTAVRAYVPEIKEWRSFIPERVISAVLL